MTRALVVALLARLTLAGHLSALEAQSLLSAWEDGRIADDDLPAEPDGAGVARVVALALSAGVTGAALRRLLEAAREREAFRPFAVDLGLGRVGLDALPAARRDTLARELLDVFAREADRRTGLLFQTPEEAGAARRSAGSVRRWQVAMRQAVAEDLAALARLGAGRPLTAEEAAQVARVAAEQARYLDGFAVRVSQGRAGLAPELTERQVAARLRMYGGEGLAAFYRHAHAGLAPGWVLDYDAVDDGGTCSACLGAERGGPYVPGAAPLPGSTCFGRGHCRCSLTPRYDPAAYARLTGAARRQAA